MSEPFSLEETRRVARLARVAVAPDEEARVAAELRAIAVRFGDLAAYADGLPDAPEVDAGNVREDVAAPSPAAAVDDIIAQVPHVDVSSRAVRVPRPQQQQQRSPE